MRCTGVFRLPVSGGDALHLVQREASVRVSGTRECEGVHARVLCHETTHAGHCKTGEREKGGAERVKILVSAREVRIGTWAARGGWERAGNTKIGGRGGDADKNVHTHTHKEKERDMRLSVYIYLCGCVCECECTHAHTL